MLRCEECGSEDERGEGWLAFLTVDNDTAVYCPDCAKRKFGQDPSRPLDGKHRA